MKNNKKQVLKFVLLIIAVFLSKNEHVSAYIPEVPGDTILYVRSGMSGDCSSWHTACELQTALGMAGKSNQIWVAQGTYKPTDTTDRNISFVMKSGVALYGGFPECGGNWDSRDWETNLTILSGDIGTEDYVPDNSYHVVIADGVDKVARLDGFAIMGGYASGTGKNSNGAGIYNYDSNLTLNEITLSHSHAYGGGGMHNESGNPNLTNVTFFNNSAINGGGMHNYESDFNMEFIIFENNFAYEDGGGMYIYHSNPNLTNVTFINNSSANRGGGIYNDTLSDPTLMNVTFTNNTSEYGGGIYNYISDPSLVNVTFSSNDAEFNPGGGMGGGMYNYHSNPTFINLTFCCNSADISGAGVYNYDSSPTITNTILWGNLPDQIEDDSTSVTNVTYSDIEGGYEGEGNINLDPLLDILADNGGFTPTQALLAGSPAIDAGSPTICPDTDQRGVARPIDGDGIWPAICDMGAYEYDNEFFIYVFLPLILR